MKLNNSDTYSCMFSLLDSYWEQTQLEDLGGLLGSMNPNLLVDGVPIDDKLIFDWNNIVSGESNYMTETQGYNFVIQFIEKQESWLDLSVVVFDLKKAYENQDSYWVTWLKLCKKKKKNIT